MLLNAAWILCSLPLVTIGVSTTALYDTTIKMVRKKETYPAKMFFHAFRQNLKQGIAMTFLLLFGAVVLYLDLNITRNTDLAFGQVLSIVFLALFFVFFMVASYAFPLLAQFENTIRGTLKNALFMSIWHLPYTLLILLLNTLPVLLFFLSPSLFAMSLIVWVLVGVAGAAYLNGRLFVKIFDRYIQKQETPLEL